MAKEPKTKMFATEAALCAAFIKRIDDKWIVYAETCSWDILLVRRLDGFQIGFQAKLKLNADVVSQALEDDASWIAFDRGRAGPDCRAILIPGDIQNAHAFDKICAYIGVTIIRVSKGRYGRMEADFSPDLPTDPKYPYGAREWYEMAPAKRHDLPAYVPDVAAGAPSPLQLTDWKIKAIKIAVLLDRRGRVSRKDFSFLKLDHRRWVTTGWIRATPAGYVADMPPDFKRQHPVVYEKIAADFDKWAPPVTLVEIAAPAQELPL